MKTYEGLFILDTAGKEEVSKELMDKLQKSIEHAGGRVDKVQRMGIRPFARDTRKRTSGFYVNFVFDAPPKLVLLLLQIEPRLEIQPKPLGEAEITREAECRVRADRALPENNLVDAARRNADVFSQTILADPQRP